MVKGVFQYIRDYYGVPAKRGGHIIWNGRRWRIYGVTETAHLKVVNDETGWRITLHPTAGITYEDGNVQREGLDYAPMWKDDTCP